MKTNGALIIVCIVISLFVFNSEAGEGKIDVNKFLEGKNYTKGDYGGRFLHVTFLKDGYTLENREERQPERFDYAGIPLETHVRCYLIKDQKIVKMVSSLNDLRGYVVLDSEEKAIEFVRLLTSAYTYFLFRPEIMVEVVNREKAGFPKYSIDGEASADFFEKHKLQELKVVRKNGYFEITRDLVYFPWYGAKDYPGPAKVFRALERVYSDGQYHMEKTLYLSEVNYKDISYPLLPK